MEVEATTSTQQAAAIGSGAKRGGEYLADEPPHVSGCFPSAGGTRRGPDGELEDEPAHVSRCLPSNVRKPDEHESCEAPGSKRGLVLNASGVDVEQPSQPEEVIRQVEEGIDSAVGCDSRHGMREFWRQLYLKQRETKRADTTCTGRTRSTANAIGRVCR